MATVPSPPPTANGVPPPPPTSDEPTLTGMHPIPAKKTLMIVNSFIINTVDFLNKFAAVAEEKLRKVQQAIQRVEITLALLEGKLESVPWLSGDGPPPAPITTTTTTDAVPGAPPISSSNSTSSSPSPPPPPTPQLLLKDDERYKKYFKMLGMGVPKQALRMKTSADGVDPDVIDLDPEGPAPEGAEAAAATDNVDENSDDGGNDSD